MCGDDARPGGCRPRRAARTPGRSRSVSTGPRRGRAAPAGRRTAVPTAMNSTEPGRPVVGALLDPHADDGVGAARSAPPRAGGRARGGGSRCRRRRARCTSVGAVVVDVLPADVVDRGAHHGVIGLTPRPCQGAPLADAQIAAERPRRRLGVLAAGRTRSGARPPRVGMWPASISSCEAAARSAARLGGLPRCLRGGPLRGLLLGAAAREERAHRSSSCERRRDRARSTSARRRDALHELGRSTPRAAARSRLRVMPRTTLWRVQRASALVAAELEAAPRRAPPAMRRHLAALGAKAADLAPLARRPGPAAPARGCSRAPRPTWRARRRRPAAPRREGRGRPSLAMAAG